MDLTFVVACKGRLAHLRQTLPTIIADARARCVVVDYNCPEATGAWVAKEYPAVKVIQVPSAKGFNRAHALNLGVAAASTPWICFTDADILWRANSLSEILPLLRPGVFLRSLGSATDSGLCGTSICQKADCELVGGIDEAFQGWGLEDEDFYGRLLRRGVRQTTFAAELASHIPHSTAARNTFYGERRFAASWFINFLYAKIRDHLALSSGGELSLADRRVLHGQVNCSLDPDTVLGTLWDRASSTHTFHLELDLSNTAEIRALAGCAPNRAIFQVTINSAAELTASVSGPAAAKMALQVGG